MKKAKVPATIVSAAKTAGAVAWEVPMLTQKQKSRSFSLVLYHDALSGLNPAVYNVHGYWIWG